MSQKIKVLALCDYACSTGFATVASNIMRELDKTGKYELTIIGINYNGEPYDQERYPGMVYPAMNILSMQGNDVYGRQRLLNMLGTGKYDIFFTIQDTFIIQTIIKQIVETNEILDKKFKSIFYFPFDATPKDEWITECVSYIDYPVPYTEYARELILDVMPELEDKLQVIYHGNNFDEFHYVEDREKVAEFRRNYFSGHTDDKFLLMNLNRNQPRKDVIRNFQILKELRDRGEKDVILYLHMAHDDAGGNVLVMANNFGFKINEDFIVPSPKLFEANRGLPVEIINYLYNCADAVITTTLGEGWGLSVTEAMATRTPVVAPDNTSLHEMLADNRAKLVPSGANPSLWFSLGGQDNERLRPLMDVEAAAEAVIQIKNGSLPDLDAAEAWVKSLSWEKICKQWVKIFDEAGEAAIKATEEAANPKLSRQQRRALSKGKKKQRIPV